MEAPRSPPAEPAGARESWDGGSIDPWRFSTCFCIRHHIFQGTQGVHGAGLAVLLGDHRKGLVTQDDGGDLDVDGVVDGDRGSDAITEEMRVHRFAESCLCASGGSSIWPCCPSPAPDRKSRLPRAKPRRFGRIPAGRSDGPRSSDRRVASTDRAINKCQSPAWSSKLRAESGASIGRFPARAFVLASCRG